VIAVKEKINSIVNQQPDDSSFEEILRELVFAKMIDNGLADSDKGKLTSHKLVMEEIESWSE
jgi:predicted transcriptional regulator